MSVEIVSQKGTQLTLQIKVDISGTMLEAEEKILSSCNEAGMVSTQKVLERFDADGAPIMVGDNKYTSKGAVNKNLPNPLWFCVIKTPSLPVKSWRESLHPTGEFSKDSTQWHAKVCQNVIPQICIDECQRDTG